MSGDSEKSSNWIVDHGLSLAIKASLVVIAASIILWLTGLLWLDPMFSRQSPAVVLDEAGVYISVEMETAVAADGRPVKLAFAIHNQSAITQTVSLTATTTSEQLLFTTPPQLSDITVSPQTMVTQTIAVANSSPNRLGASEVLSVTAVLATSQPDGVPLTVYSEGTWGRGLRQLVNSTVQQASPLIIVIAFLVPIFLQLVQVHFKREKEKQAKQQANKQKEREKQIDGWLKELRSAILAKNFSKAKEVLYDSRFSNVQNKDVQTAKKLLELADSLPNEDKKAELVSIIQDCFYWPDECGMVFVVAWRNVKKNNKIQEWFETFQQAKLWLPTTEMKRIDIVGRLAGLEQEFVALQQEKNERSEQKKRILWPKPSAIPSIAPRARPDVTNQLLGKVDPFPYIDAHQDLYNLFALNEREEPAFWGGHPIFNTLFQADRATLVEGHLGSGKTTLAHAIHYHAIQRQCFALHIPGQPNQTEIQIRFGYHMLDFILSFPEYLGRLTVSQRKLLAHFLAVNIPNKTLSARIETKWLDILSWKYREKSVEDLSDQLQRFVKLVETIDIDYQNSSGMDWVSDISSITESLGFNRTFLVLDIDTNNREWINQVLVRNLVNWQIRGLLTIVFLPNTLMWSNLVNLNVNLWYLFWSKEQLKKMVEQRYKTFAGRNQVIQSLFADSHSKTAFDYLIDQCGEQTEGSKSYNPGRFIFLWQKLMDNYSSDIQITKEQIDHVINDLDSSI